VHLRWNLIEPYTMECVLFLFLLFFEYGMSIQVSIIMRGSDYINTSFVSSFGVNQYDLGDVYLSPCRTETYSSDHSGICKDCTSCISEEYEQALCLADQNRVCSNCSTCNEHEHQICECNIKTQTCYLGNRICAPLSPTDINITFELTMGNVLSTPQLHFVENGLSTGFPLFLSEYLNHAVENIEFKGLTNVKGLLYYSIFIIHSVYDKDTIYKAETIDKTVVQQGLSYTFGIAFSGTSRRLLASYSPITNISAGPVTTSCIVISICPTFFHLSVSNNTCDNLCVYDPCPMGYTGDFGSCILCPNTTFKDTIGNDTCKSCPMGYTSNMGSTSEIQCTRFIFPSTTSMAPTTTGVYLSGTNTISQMVIDQNIMSTTTYVRYNQAITSTTMAQTNPPSTSMLVTTPAIVKTDPLPVTSVPVTTILVEPPPSTAQQQQVQVTSIISVANNQPNWILPYQSSIPFVIFQDNGYGYLAIVSVVAIMMCGILSLAGIAAKLYYTTTRRGWFYIPIDTGEEEPKKIIPHTIIRKLSP